MRDNQKFIEYILKDAKKIAYQHLSNEVTLEHMLMAVISNSIIEQYIIDNLGKANFEKINLIIDDYLTNSVKKTTNNENLKISDSVQLYIKAFLLTCDANEEVINNDNEFYAINLLSSFFAFMESDANKILQNNNITPDWILDRYQKYAVNKIVQEKVSSNEQLTDDLILEKLTINLSNQVDDSNWLPLIGRENEIKILEQILLRKEKPNAILVGKAGIGKSKIIEGLVKKHSEFQFLQLDILSMTSGIAIKGELEARVNKLCSIIKQKKNIVLVIDNIHLICQGGDSQQSDIATLMKPLISNGELKIIGITTFEDYRKYMEKNETFIKKFYKMNIEEMTNDENIEVLKSVSKSFGQYYNLNYANLDYTNFLYLCNRYIFDGNMPSKGIDVLDACGAYCQQNGIKNVSIQEIKNTISQYLNIPLLKLNQSENEIYLNLENIIKEKIYGQDDAIQKVCDAVIISKSGLRETNKTAVSMMFSGSSGCGKTELCRVLSDVLNIPLVRFDMTEFMEENSIPKLIGSPPGYKDAGDGKAGSGLLINAIDEHPYCILLLDEIEKAHSKIHNLLLQVMDNGKLTSSMGKTVSFENVFLIMTSNVGSYNAHKLHIGFGNNDESISTQDYEDKFLPEFRNRLDAMIVFNNLSLDILKQITNKFLLELKETLKEKKIDFEFENDIIEYISNRVLSINNGARPIKHIITDEIKNVIAKDIVFGKLKESSKIKVKLEDNKIIVEEN